MRVSNKFIFSSTTKLKYLPSFLQKLGVKEISFTLEQ